MAALSVSIFCLSCSISSCCCCLSWRNCRMYSAPRWSIAALLTSLALPWPDADAPLPLLPLPDPADAPPPGSKDCNVSKPFLILQRRFCSALIWDTRRCSYFGKLINSLKNRSKQFTMCKLTLYWVRSPSLLLLREVFWFITGSSAMAEFDEGSCLYARLSFAYSRLTVVDIKVRDLSNLVGAVSAFWIGNMIGILRQRESHLKF